jgi:hypothetical protein
MYSRALLRTQSQNSIPRIKGELRAQYGAKYVKTKRDTTTAQELNIVRLEAIVPAAYKISKKVTIETNQVRLYRTLYIWFQRYASCCIVSQDLVQIANRHV